MSSQAPDADRSYSLFKELLGLYEREPTLANYVRLRRTFGGSGVQAARFIEFDPFSIEPELRQFGIDPSLVRGALEGDELQVDQMTLRLMECVVDRERIEKSGQAHLQSRRLAISDSLIDYLIVAMLEAAEEHDASIPPSLIILIRERLCGTNPDRYKEQLRQEGRQDAVALAALKFPSGKVSIRSIANLMEVEPSTISRWFPDGDFQQHVDKFRGSIDALGLRKKHADG
jgi:hypothetical protein